jgi:hypothetical protein
LTPQAAFHTPIGESNDPAPSEASTDSDDAVPPQVPAYVCNDVQWWDDEAASKVPINGPVSFKGWGIRSAIGETFVYGSDVSRQLSRLDYFFLLFPPAALTYICRLTNYQLANNTMKETNIGELLRFFGIWMLSTRFEFGSRASLWSTTAPFKYVPAPAFGRTGMPRHRFDAIWRYIRFSDQPDERPEEMSSEKYRWRLVDDFVDQFNNHRANNFFPSDLICVDESISRWYGQGGHWINLGLPMYIAFDRKPENGCEIQNSACGRSGIMMRLKLVKTSEEEGTNLVLNEDEGLLHGTIVLKSLVSPWFHSDRIVCADSYFASVGCAKELLRNGLRFIGVVKTATREFPKAYLSQLELQERGTGRDWSTVTSMAMPTSLHLCGWTETGAISYRAHRRWKGACPMSAAGGAKSKT